MTHWKISLAAAAVLALGAVSVGNACTRFTYVGADNAVYTGRTMDWSVTDNVSLHLMPRSIGKVTSKKGGLPNGRVNTVPSLPFLLKSRSTVASTKLVLPSTAYGLRFPTTAPPKKPAIPLAGTNSRFM